MTDTENVQTDIKLTLEIILNYWVAICVFGMNCASYNFLLVLAINAKDSSQTKDGKKMSWSSKNIDPFTMYTQKFWAEKADSLLQSTCWLEQRTHDISEK